MCSVTSVGGTIDIPQTAVNFSAGGFSNIFPRPPFQSTAVPTYLAAYGNLPTDAGLYNASGRGIPDVAAYAVDFSVVLEGTAYPVSGTSCASPTFASVVALVNDALLAAGRPVLGYLNPWLYADGWRGLTDITTGNNFACSNYTTGFEAAVGWDPVSLIHREPVVVCCVDSGLRPLVVGDGLGYAGLCQAAGCFRAVNVA